MFCSCELLVFSEGNPSRSFTVRNMGSGEKKTDTFIVVSRRSGRYMFDQFRPIKM